MEPPNPSHLSQLRQRCREAFAAHSAKIAEICANAPRQTPPSQTVLGEDNSGSNEYADTWGFSWMPALEEFMQRDASAADPPAKPYNETLKQDRNFYNPAAVELMSQMYRIDPYASIVHTTANLGDWDYASIRTQQDAAWANEQVKKGVAMAKEKRYEGAIKYYTRALSIVPSHVDALVARGAAYANEGSLQRAIQDFEQALIEDPSCTNAAEYLTATKRKFGFTSSGRPRTPQKDTARRQEDSIDVQNGSEQKNDQLEMSASDRLRKLIEADEERRRQKRDRDRSRRSEDGMSESSSRKKKKKKEKDKHKSKKQKKKKKHKKSKSESRSDSSSDDSDEAEDVHPILQRQRHKLWG